MTIVPFQPQTGVAVGRPTWIDVMDRGVELAEIIANTDFVPKALRGNQPAILACILYGHELGLEPMHSLNVISVIEGKPSLSAEAQRGLILAAGHEFWLEDVTNTHATAVGRRRESKQTHRATWTLDDAKRARIAGRPNYQAYPRQMLVARASAELARQIFADVVGGFPATEELDGESDAVTGQTEASTTLTATTRKRRRPSSSSHDVLGAVVGALEEQPPSDPPPAEPTPEPSPEPEPTSEPAAAPDPPSDKTIGLMFALYKDKGMLDRDTRLAHAEGVLGRTIGSSNELTSLDMSRIITALEEMPDLELPKEEQQVVDDLERELDARPALPDDPT